MADNGTDPAAITLDLNTLTIDEVIDFEEISNIPFEEYTNGGKGVKKGPALKALMFIALRRSNPDITLAEVGSMTIETVTRLNVETNPVNPTGGD